MSEGFDRYAAPVLCAKVECESYHPTQQCDHGPRYIRLSVEGADWQIAEVAAVLRRLTALPKKTKDNSGDLRVPLTWALVTQMSRLMRDKEFGWRPSPALNLWIAQEFERRFDEGPGELKFDVKSLHRSPMPHQAAGAYVGALNKRFLFGDEAGPQPVSTPVLTTRGWTELGKLKPGDRVYAEDGSATCVTEVKFFGKQPVYRVTLNDRTSTVATASHHWRVFTSNHRGRPGTRLGKDGYVMSTQQIMSAGLHSVKGGQPSAKWFLPPQPVIDAGPRPHLYEVDPYAYGALLGDGHLAEGRASLCCPDKDIHFRVAQAALSIGTTNRTEDYADRCLTTHFRRDGRLLTALRIIDALYPAAEKHVHPWYLLGDMETRCDLLRGLLDTDGSVADGNSVEFSSASPQLAADVAYLGRSLGAVATESYPQPAWYVKGGERVECQDKHRVFLRFPTDGLNPFWCERKASAWRTGTSGRQRKNPPRSIQAIEPAGEADVCCISVEDERRLYLTDRTLIPTHNCGKTMTALLTLAELEAQGQDPFPAFVVAPASVVDPWLEELEACFPDWPVTAYRGPRRHNLSARYKVYVMSWDTFRTDMKHEHDELPTLLKFAVPKSVIYDECHALVNVKTKQSVAAKKLARVAEFAVLMSGTPITRDVGGFWTALNVLDIRSFPDQDRYKDMYTDRYQGDYSDQIDGLKPETREEFYNLMQGSMRRVAKQDVLTDLPPKTYSTRVVQIPPAYRAAYDEMQEDMLAHIPDTDEPLEVMTVLAQLQRLTQLASSACDVEVTMELDEREGSATFGMEVPKTHVTMREPSWKVDEMMALLDEMQGSPLLAFSPHTQLMKLAGARAEKHGYRVGYVVGGQSAAQRTKVRKAFQAGELDLLCANVTAGGVGLTLTAASTVVFLERPWAYWQASQAEDRVHRRGQTEQVHVIDIVAADSVESRVRQAMKDKSKQLAELVRDPRIVEEFLGGQDIHVR